MGLDIYAGTLTRYYTHNWKTVLQQWAEENGYSYSKISPEGGEATEDAMTTEEIQRAIEDWRDWILAAVTPEGGEPYAPWREDNEKPYYTDKPDWEAFGALLLYAACLLYKEPLPLTVEKRWDFDNHPLVKRAAEDSEKQWSLFAGTTWWLPITEPFYFQAQNPVQDSISIGTTGALLEELKKINELGWKADEETILSWVKTEGYPADAEISANGQMTEIEEHTIFNTESLAKFSFSILWQAVSFSMEHQVPVLMDF